MSTYKIAISARLRPRLPSEQVDDSIHVFQDDNAGGSYVVVTNPRDPSQVFKFPYVDETLSWGPSARSQNGYDRFTSCYDQDSTQEQIFARDVSPMIDVVFSGVVSLLSFPSNLFFIPRMKSFPTDCNHLCIWCDLFRKNIYHARNQVRSRCYPSCCSGKVTVRFFYPRLTQEMLCSQCSIRELCDRRTTSDSQWATWRYIKMRYTTCWLRGRM